MYERLRIAIIAHLKYALVEPYSGGLEMHTHALASKLEQRGHDVTLYASAGSSADCAIYPACDETHKFPSADAYRLEHEAYTDIMTKVAGGDYDVVHNNSLHYVPPAWAAKMRAPMVTVLHTPPFSPLAESLTATSTRSKIVAVSDAVSRMWSDAVTVSAVIRNGIDLHRFAFHPEASREPYVVWSGRLVPEKGLPAAIAAARRAGFAIRIAGPVIDVGYYETAIAPLLGPGVHYVGHLSHGELATMIGGARAFVASPLWDEPYGLVVAEALACGTPVAAFCRGAMPEILDQACGAMASVDDIASLAGAIGEAVSLDRAACRRRAQMFCDAERMIDRYEAFYRSSVLERPSDPRVRISGIAVPSLLVDVVNADRQEDPLTC